MSSKIPPAGNSDSADIFTYSTFKKKRHIQTPFFIIMWYKTQDDNILTNLVASYLRIKILPKRITEQICIVKSCYRQFIFIDKRHSFIEEFHLSTLCSECMR